ncbi:MAG: hypothetical protein AB7G11_04865 [Phycisphaerales bacterium]
MAASWWDKYLQDGLGECAGPHRADDASASPSTLDLQLHASDRRAFMYSQLLWTLYREREQNDLIQLHFSTHTVDVVGLRLGAVYEALLRREVASLRVVDERYLDPESRAPAVTRIEIAPSSRGPAIPEVPLDFTDDNERAE